MAIKDIEITSNMLRNVDAQGVSAKGKRIAVLMLVSIVFMLTTIEFKLSSLYPMSSAADTLNIDTADVQTVSVVPSVQPDIHLQLSTVSLNDLIELTADISNETEENLGASYDIPSAETGRKTFMDYRAITCKASKQYAIQQKAWTDGNGFRRSGDYYLVAMGTYYAAECGKTFQVSLDNGTTFDVMVGDIKADCDTDEANQHRNGNVIEFIIDSDHINRNCKLMGDMSYTDGLDFYGKIISITEILNG